MIDRITKYINYYRDGVLEERIKTKIVNITRPFWIAIMTMFPIKSNKVCFDSFEGTGFGGDPKYIALELLNRKKELEIIWLVRKVKNDFPEGIKQVKINSIAAIYHQSTSAVWVDNIRTGLRTKKRKNQFYLQTWHGNLLGKKIEKDVESKLWPSYVKVAKYDGSVTDAFLVANESVFNLAKNSFWLNNGVEYLKIGAPANDALLLHKDDKNFLYNKRSMLHIQEKSFVILYAPSFRDDGSTNGYLTDFEAIKQTFKEKFNRDVVILVRFHPDVVELDHIIEYKDNIINVTRYPDLKDLSLIADCLITDYSSVTYDFLLLNKPIFRLCLDFDHYVSLRDFYKEFYELPYGLYKTLDEFLTAVLKFDYNNYTYNIECYKNSNPLYDKGDASKLAADWIVNKLI